MIAGLAEVPRWLATLGLFCAACATLPVPEALGVARERESLETTRRARELAPQAFAHAKGLRERADAAYEAGDRSSAEILAEHSLAAFQRAVVQARIVRATQRMKESQAALTATETELVELTRAQQETEAQAKALELRVRVARDAEPLGEVEPSGPAREAARREAALSILEAARLLCLSAKMLDASLEQLNAVSTEIDALERQLERQELPTPIDRAMTLRADCLRSLTLTRRSARRAAPEEDPADVLLVQLKSALPNQFPVRDDRGIVIASDAVFSGRRAELTADGLALAKSLSEISRANMAFPLLVVLHGAETLSQARSAALARALSDAGVSNPIVHSVGTRIPSSLVAAKVLPPTGSRVEFVLVAPR